jgi:hypothetical protein
MTLRDVKNWRVDDQFPGIAIESIPLLSDKLNSLYARAIDREHLQSSFMQLAGIIFIAKELEYHFDNFQRLVNFAALPTVERFNDSERNKSINEAKFEAIAYINTVGRINAWIHYIHAHAPKIAEISQSFRNKHTAHRSIDAPRSESDELQDLHAFVFMGNLWNSQGDLIFQIQKELGETVGLNIIQEHKIILDEILEAFSNSLELPSIKS